MFEHISVGPRPRGRPQEKKMAHLLSLPWRRLPRGAVHALRSPSSRMHAIGSAMHILRQTGSRDAIPTGVDRISPLHAVDAALAMRRRDSEELPENPARARAPF